jgi:hypothetical protein
MSVSSPSRLNGQRERAETLLRTPSVGAEDCDSGYGLAQALSVSDPDASLSRREVSRT